ncbi:DUF2303 family protein [Campylobacter pinnipediorum]|uniref:DUF2303 family protein n=1 Tax=Campylobacter pinnipediorum TaxID=1965231 RepID=UPI00084DC2E1|nr:DUF2303 family protein [Campylobacter pinnipediorum]AQW80772.1 putative DUF2303 domain protein [Campylobacter pinnipediorum subsp. pinnipediorum]AQW83342.1 putative DUF2303 domain protein [Campylobacter pinnipediorum subsp. pinnipediorum]OPA75415.1 hypothetical protein BFG05_05955 [Campylobacter pinnipediorum subsp. pinnipediorum]
MQEVKILNEIIPSVEIDKDKRAILVHKEYELNRSLLKEPLRNQYTIDALNVDSFVNLVNEYKEPSSKLFYNDRKISCVIDFNTKEKAEFCDKLINLELRYTPFYGLFSKNISQPLSQREFVFFLKSIFMFISKIDDVKNDNMDVIELAESLQAVKKFDSVQKNASSKMSLDVEIKSGTKESLSIPKKLTFELPIYEANTAITGTFETELFVEISDDNKFSLRLVCFTEENVRRDVLARLTNDISERCDGVKAFNATV